MTKNEQQLIDIVSGQDWLMAALKAVRELDLPDWYIAAGAVRNTVWNYLHDMPLTANQNDIDVIYFDEEDVNSKREEVALATLNAELPDLEWEVVNQARAHLFELDERVTRLPVKSSCESISYWSEIPTCIGVRLKTDNSFTICAPYGLDDLFKLVVKPIPKPKQDLSLYETRLNKKGWDKIWPKLKISNY